MRGFNADNGCLGRKHLLCARSVMMAFLLSQTGVRLIPISNLPHHILFKSEGRQEAIIRTIMVKKNDLNHPPLILDELDLLRLGP
jgi:hypothetical protein